MKNRAITPKLEVKCLDCNVVFMAFSSKQKRCTGCQKKHKNLKPNYEYPHICVDCGTSFKHKSCRRTRCDECIPKGVCGVCNTDFVRNVLNQTKKYCSPKCDFMAKLEAMYSWNYYKVLSRDNFKCRKCGCSEDDAKLNLHHIDNSGMDRKTQQGSNNEMENLITLCDGCHQTLHNITNRTLVQNHMDETKQILNDFIGGV